MDSRFVPTAQGQGFRSFLFARPTVRGICRGFRSRQFALCSQVILYAARSLRLSSAIVTLLLYPILKPVKSGSVQVTLVSPNEQQGSRRVDLDRVLLAVDGKNLLHGVALKGCVRACHSRFAQNVAGASRTDRVRAIVMHNAVAIRSSQRGMETSPTVG